MIVVVGAGLSGLAVGRALQRGRARFVILEAAGRTGGVIHSQLVGGQPLESGPQRARLTAQLQGLIRELGIADQLILAPRGLPLFVYVRGRLRRVPFSLRELARTDLLSTAAKLRLLLEPITRGAARDETVASFFERRFGSAAYVNLLGPLLGGLYGSDPADMLVRHTLAPALRQFDVGHSAVLAAARQLRRGTADIAPACSFEGGLQTLTDALERSLAGHVRLGQPASALRRRPDGGLVVATAGGEIAATAIVLAVPADVAAQLLDPIDPAGAERLRRLRYNRLAVVHLRSVTALEGMGCQVALGEPLATRGITFNHALFGRAGLYTVFLGGAHAAHVMAGDDATLAEAAARDFATITGAEGTPLQVTRVRMPAWDRSWTALDDYQPPAGIHLCANWVSRPGIPGRFANAEQVGSRLSSAVRAGTTE